MSIIKALCAMYVPLVLAGVVSCDNSPAAPDDQPAAPKGMKLVAGGTFTMGSSDTSVDVSPIERPAHTVTVSGFFMDTTEVTQQSYLEIMGKNPAMHNSGDSRLPVDHVTWCEAALYCNKRSKLAGKDTVYSYDSVGVNVWAVDTPVTDLYGLTIDFTKKGFRLPTEAEWEYACRAGTTTDFITGTDTAGINEYVWWFYNSGDTSHQVATKKPNHWGLYDMIGNLWEWVNDVQGDYGSASQTDPTGPAAPATGLVFRVQRGGMYTQVSGGGEIIKLLRSTNREAKSQSSYAPDRGFRCVCSVK
jgi:formylglycine-generating enzyme required for sulfatase activity